MVDCFEVQCLFGENSFCVEVPVNCSVNDMLRRALEHSETSANRASLGYSDIPLDGDEIFADYFEPDAVYQVRVGRNCPEGTLLSASESEVKALGVNLMEPQLLMEMEELWWSMDEFLKKAADFAPTLVLIKMKNGTVCGGVAGVPWPKEPQPLPVFQTPRSPPK
jgi:hypothetical protein